MHPELHFHVAVKLIYGDRGPGFGEELEELKQAISAAQDYNGNPPWLAQLLAIEAAYEYSLENFKKAGELLESALKYPGVFEALKPHLGEPFSSDDLQSLALILKSSGDVAARPFHSELIRARPKLEYALDTVSALRKDVFEAFINSMVPGVDIGAPIPGSPPLGVADIDQLVQPLRPRQTEDY